MNGSLHSWAKALEGRVVGASVRCPGPGHSPHDDSLVVTPAPDSRDGFTVYSHAGDDWRTCKDYVRERLGLPSFEPHTPEHDTLRRSPQRRAPMVRPKEPLPLDVAKRTLVAGDIWRASLPFAGSPAQQYLERRLKGRAVPQAVLDGGSLRWNPSVRIDGAVGAMVALMVNPITGQPSGIHRTYITAAGDNVRDGKGKSVRRMLGRHGVVKLWPDEDVLRFLCIGEGIESVIAGAIESGLSPAWAALDAGQVETFPPLVSIEGLTIFVDHDPSGTGQRAAEACAARWYEAAGVKARFLTPTAFGDFNDILGEPA